MPRWHAVCLKRSVKTQAYPVLNGHDHMGSASPLRVGLVNNMPDAALSATERQFGALLRAAAGDRGLELVLIELSEIKRDPSVRASMRKRYLPADEIGSLGLDAMVVTGAKPGAGPLRETPLWTGFVRLVDQALDLRLPTLWSCLAGHAAVEYLDGIQRRRLPTKRFGVFSCQPAVKHPLLAGIDQTWDVPHSRLHDLDEGELLARGYQILTRSDAIGVDSFIRPGPPLFLFLQGHPEYGAHSLVQEYLRDLRLFLQGAIPAAPSFPPGLLEAKTEAAWTRAAEALIGRGASSFSLKIMPPLGPDDPELRWRGFAMGLIANWLKAAEPRRSGGSVSKRA